MCDTARAKRALQPRASILRDLPARRPPRTAIRDITRASPTRGARGTSHPVWADRDQPCCCCAWRRLRVRSISDATRCSTTVTGCWCCRPRTSTSITRRRMPRPRRSPGGWRSGGTRGCRLCSTTRCTGRQPIVLYGSHRRFEQTNIYGGLIEESTGGFTDARKRRIVLPFAASLADTDHVLGHEIVHAFQFDIADRSPQPARRAAVVRRGHGRVPHARRRRSADRDVDARCGAERPAARHQGSRHRRAIFPIAGARRCGRTWSSDSARICRRGRCGRSAT